MPLEPAAEMLADARRRGYALAHFESWDLASLMDRGLLALYRVLPDPCQLAWQVNEFEWLEHDYMYIVTPAGSSGRGWMNEMDFS